MVQHAHALGYQVKVRIRAQVVRNQDQDLAIYREPADDALQEANRNGSRS